MYDFHSSNLSHKIFMSIEVKKENIKSQKILPKAQTIIYNTNVYELLYRLFCHLENESDSDNLTYI